MPPSPIPAPLPPWARALLQVLPFISAGLQEVLQYIGSMNTVDETAQSSWRHLSVVLHRGGFTNKADDAIVGFDIANITQGALDSSWTDQDYSDVQGIMGALINNLMSFSDTSATAYEMRYYRRAFNELSDPHPFAKSGPPERVYNVGYTGFGNLALPAQVALSVTERTAYPRHWGRFYWPFVNSTVLAANGSVAVSTVDALCLAVHDAYAALQAKEFFPVVPVTQVDKVATRGLLTVPLVQVDSTPDVVRRRRITTTAYRKVL